MFRSKFSPPIVVSNDNLLLLLSMLQINCFIVPIVTDAVEFVLDKFEISVLAEVCLEFAVK